MRIHRVAFALAFTASGAAHAQDFDPHGRHRSQAASHGPAPSQGGPQAAPTSSAAGGPSQNVLLERYIRVVLSQPGTAFPLQRLAQLYREKDGSLARGIADFEARARSGVDAYAATVALAGMYKQDGRPTEAVAAYERAIALKKDDPSAVLALARLLEDSGDRRGARNRYEQALLLQAARTDREQTLRTLMGLALDDSDWAQAQAFHRKLLQLEPTSLFVRGELGRELFNRGEFAQAETELKDVVVAAAGDNRALAPALKELGRAQVKAHEHAAALSTLKRALVAAGDQSALRAEIYATIAEIYRADQQLPVLVKELEDEHPSDLSRLALLGGLYEEVGDGAKAIETYRRAILSNPRQVDLRLRMIRLLQANGDLDRAIAEYEGLIQAAPDNPQFVFEEGEALMQRGDRARAIRLVSELEARASNDEEVLARVAEFYGRIGENERSLRVLQRLAATSGSSDPGHLVDLGDRYFQDGRVPLALETWKRILTVVEPRARALAALGDVYLEHDMGSEAVAAYREASLLDPKNLGYKKSLAASQERVHAYREARALYEEIAAKAQENGDRALVRECRTRIVTLWGLERVIEQHLPSLRAQFGAAPPDPEAGRMLAEALLHLRRLPEAEATLRRVIDLSPGDAETYLALERVLVQESKIADAIGVLERLAALDPKRARELYERMAQYALQTYRDEDAIRYAARAVELNPDDAEGHRRLGEMYRSKQDVDHAITEFRAAIAKNDRLFLVYFELADLLLSRNQADEADRLFRSVVRGAPDEELVGRAARLSMQINVGKGTLESLEQDLLPLAIGNPQRPIYRRLLVETYGSLTFGLVQRVRHGTADESALARQALGRIGARAVKPLLDALADADVSQQRIAIDVLAYVQNRNAALPLFAFATGPSELALRTRAMLACGALADGALVPKYEALLFPTDRPGDIGLADPVGVAAVWGLARMENPRALPLLRRLAADGPPAMRALAVLGLGMARETGATAMVADIARSPDAGSVAKAAAAYALGDLDAQAQVPALLEIAEDGEPLPRRMALLALARLSSSHAKEPPWQGAAAQAMADAIFVRAGDETVSDKSSQAIARTATIALATLASHGAGVSGWARARDAMPTPDGPLDVETLLDELAPREASSAEKSAAIVLFEEPIRRAAMSALRTSGPRATAVLDALGDGDGEFLPFVVRGSTGPAAEAARRLADALEPDVVPLAKHPDAAIRAKAIVLVARSSSDAATDAVVSGLEDASEEVERVALSSLGAARSDGTPPPASARAAAAVARILATHQNWAMRVLAAEALGRLGAAGVSSAASSLGRAATTDPYALVRQAALEALAAYDATAGKALARRVATMDPEPRVRDAALLLARSPGER